MGCVCFRISKSRSCPEIPTPASHSIATEKQGKGPDSSQLLSVLSRQLSPGQGGFGDMRKDAARPSSHRDDMPSLNPLLFTRA